MREIEASEAETHFSRILDEGGARRNRGNHPRRGRPIARLVPEAERRQAEI
jgi:antitoxin (DNA-binding transcriptional repressor) of toxin-antitoxin stability system